ncbi:MAG: alpha/beta hydrolase [Desulfatitalea sp.]|nr:alpha/beta hydrolase [Desulfatitalea sp.]
MQTGLPDLKTQSIADVQIQYLEYDGDGPTVVLLHATGFLPWLWHPIAGRLARTHRVIAPFFCSHRMADPYQGGLDWLRLAEDLSRLCEALDIESPLFVGHSMGGTVSTLAHVTCKVPAGKIVLIEPILLPEEFYRTPISVEQHPLAAKAIRRRNLWRDRQEAQTDFRSKPFFQSWDAEVLSLYVTHGTCDASGDGVRLTCSPEREAALFMGGVHHDPWPLLPDVACPTLVMEGETSENRHWIDLQRVTTLIPRARYTMVLGAGHLIPMEQPETTAKLIEAFLGEPV